MNKKSQKTPVEKVQTIINAWLVFVAIIILIAAITPGCSRYTSPFPEGHPCERTARPNIFRH
jgi:hypothetical protein